MINTRYIWRNLLTLILCLAANAAWAADYVITYTNGGTTYILGYNETGTSLQTYTLDKFSPERCLWDGASGNKFQPKVNSSYYLYYTNNNTNIGLTNNTSYANNWTINTTNNNIYTGSYYIVYYNSNWQSSSNSYRSAYRATAYEVALTTATEAMNITIVGDSEIATIGSKTYNVFAQYQAAYATYSWNNGNSSYGTIISPVSVTPTLSATGITSGISFKSSTGVLSVASLSTNTTIVNITATATRNGKTGTATKTVRILGTNPPAPKISNYKENVRITAEASSDKIYYTTDGTTPTTSSTLYNGPFVVSGSPIINAIVVRGEISSTVASYTVINPSTGVSNTTVTLMDWEDIDNWTYYTGVNEDVDGGNYNTNYLGKLYSSGARNIIIEYRGGGVDNASAVAISGQADESQNTMIYYQTMEKDQINNNYPYTVIPNPFSKRPRTNGTSGTNGFWGFNGWKIIQGGEKIDGYNNNQTIPIDKDITFSSSLANNDHIILEATWVAATVRTSAPENNDFKTGTYETNFWVLNGNSTLTNLAKNMTITDRYPDGTAQSPGHTQTGGVSVSSTFTGTVKLEFIPFQSTETANAAGRNLIIGRGITNTRSGGIIYCSNNNSTVNQVVRIESGKYTKLYHFGTTLSSTTPDRLQKQHLYLGCDYDRAKGLVGNNNLLISGEMRIGNNIYTRKTSGSDICRTWAKSGKFVTNNHTDVGTALAEEGYYYGISGYHNDGHRYLEIQGGEWASIMGGIDQNNTATLPAFTLRIKGNPIIHGSIYGAAQYAGSAGTRTIVITGGSIGGWIAGGANGTQSDGGLLDGATYVYVGGNAVVNSGNSNTVINRAVGGNVFGAGCGYSSSSSSGQVNAGTNVVIADNAFVERGVYGGGSYGFTEATSRIYITGGHVQGGMGGLNTNNTDYNAGVQGGVFGGACMNKGGSSYIYQTGGKVEGGIYGGSNLSGTLSGSTNLRIVGGQVGENMTQKANVLGGGLGSATRVTNNVDVEVGGTATVYGDVYGGSEQGLVNTNASIAPTSADPVKIVNVTVSGGTINGDVYGGGLGTSANAANTYGVTKVTISGGEVEGRVFGCNNVNGTPADGDVEIEMTGGTVGGMYGGGNLAGYTGSPKVTILNGSTKAYNDIANGNVYGGGYGVAREESPTNRDKAVVVGNPTVTIGDWVAGHQVTIGGSVFGGGAYAAVEGNPTVTINDCDTQIKGDVYGGGDAAPVYSTNTTIWGGTIVGNVFGGGNGADLSKNANGAQIGYKRDDVTGVTTSGAGDVSLYVYGGTYGKWTTENGVTSCTNGTGGIFGGSNTRGDIRGGINVLITTKAHDVSAEPCALKMSEAYGAGNLAIYNPSVGNAKLIFCLGCIEGEGIDDVYGGAKQADFNGNVNLLVTAGKFKRVFGGNNISGNVNGTIKVTIDETGCKPVVIDNLYGGGNLAAYTGNPEVNVISCSYIGNIYGGGYGEGADVTGNTKVNVNQIPGKFVPGTMNGAVYVAPATHDEDNRTNDEKKKLGYIGNIYGGGDRAKVIGNTVVNIGTESSVNSLSSTISEEDGKITNVVVEKTETVAGANITGDVYGGGNKAVVTGKTTVNVGKK